MFTVFEVSIFEVGACHNRSKIFNILESEDVINTLKAVEKFGVKYLKKKIILKFLELA